MTSRKLVGLVLLLALMSGGCGDKNGKVLCSVDWSSQPEWRLDTLAVAQEVAVNGIWGVNENEVYAVGKVDSGQGPVGVIWKYNGTTWSVCFARNNADFRDIHGTSAHSVWVAGIDSPAAYPGAAVVMHWNGTDWMERSPDSSIAGLLALWAADDQDVYAIDRKGAVIRYEGVAWTEEDTPVEDDPPFTLFDQADIWGAEGGGQLTVYAGLAVGNLRGVVLRKSASGWGIDFRAPDLGYASVFVGIWAEATGDVYALESTGRGAVPVGRAYQRADTGWVSESFFSVARLFSGIRGDGKGVLFAFGWGLYRLSGASWTLYEDYPSVREVFLQDVWINHPGLFAVGKTGRSDVGVCLIGDFTPCIAK